MRHRLGREKKRVRRRGQCVHFNQDQAALRRQKNCKMGEMREERDRGEELREERGIQTKKKEICQLCYLTEYRKYVSFYVIEKNVTANWQLSIVITAHLEVNTEVCVVLSCQKQNSTHYGLLVRLHTDRWKQGAGNSMFTSYPGQPGVKRK